LLIKNISLHLLKIKIMGIFTSRKKRIGEAIILAEIENARAYWNNLSEQLKSNTMKKFNINDDIYIEITEAGWKHLQNTVGNSYIDTCIFPNRCLVNGTIYYRLQCHEVFSLLAPKFSSQVLFMPTILIDDSVEDKPTYDELVYALKDTHNLYIDAIKEKYGTHDITRLMGNEHIFNRLNK